MLTLEKFEEASEVVKQVTQETKLIYSDYFSHMTGNKVYLKPENMQRTGAYKLRGAYYKISTLPKRETDYIFDIDDDELAGMALFAKKVAKALKKAVPCRKVGVAVLGLEVPHAHIHLIPITKEGDMDFGHKISDPDPVRMEEIAASVREALA